MQSFTIILTALSVCSFVRAQQTDFTFDDIFNFRPKGFDGTWMGNQDILIYKAENGDISAFDPVQNSTQVLMEAAAYTGIGGERYFVSPDMNYILVATQMQQVWRRSRTAVMKIYNRTAPENSRWIDFPNDPVLRTSRMQYAKWAPNSNALSFVYGNDLWYQASPGDTPRHLTITGDMVYVFNGRGDWLYEEDVIGTDEAHYFSPSGDYIVYGFFNNSNMDLIRFPIFGQEEDMYGRIEEITFPKAGVTAEGRNTKGELYVVDVRNPGQPHKKLQPPDVFRTVDHYFTGYLWKDSTHIIISWVNRPQNQSVFSICDVTTAACIDNWPYIVVDGWVKVPHQGWKMSGDASRFFTLLAENVPRVGPFKHVAEVTAPLDRAGQPTFLTAGETEHSAIVGYDDTNKFVYSLATANQDPKTRHLYRIRSTQGPPEVTLCMTCDLDPKCQYVSASFSPSGFFYVQTCGGPGVPTYVVKDARVYPNTIVYTIQNNTAFAVEYDNKKMPIRFNTKVTVGGGYEAEAELLLPPNINTTDGSLYNVLVFTYAGPESQRINYAFNLGSNNNGWINYLPAQHNLVVASLDGRGTRGRGDRYMFELYRRLGTYEVWDQITGTKDLLEKFPYLNKTRPAIWGWSYGGFTTSHALSNDSTVFDCGIAVAPATSWRYVDSALAERYLGLATESDNAEGYQRTSVMARASKFQGKTLLVVHGTADDNVHIHNAAQMVRALTEAKVQFSQAYYIDKNHSIRGPDTDPHLYRKLTNFLINRCWGRPPTTVPQADKKAKTKE